jgi:Methyltransferase domain
MGRLVEGPPRITLDQALRYHSVVDFLTKHGVSEVLEVGSGSSGLAAFWPGDVTGVDLRFDGTPLPNLSVIKGNALDLPFDDRSFEAVICVDVFEHLPAGSRFRAYSELLRVTRRLAWLAFPAGKAALRTDRAIGRLGRMLRRPTPGWLVEHLEGGFPHTTETLDWPSTGFRRGWRFSLSCAAHAAVITTEHAPGGALVDRLGASRSARALLLGVPGPRYRLEQWFERHDVTGPEEE